MIITSGGKSSPLTRNYVLRLCTHGLLMLLMMMMMMLVMMLKMMMLMIKMMKMMMRMILRMILTLVPDLILSDVKTESPLPPRLSGSTFNLKEIKEN